MLLRSKERNVPVLSRRNAAATSHQSKESAERRDRGFAVIGGTAAPAKDLQGAGEAALGQAGDGVQGSDANDHGHTMRSSGSALSRNPSERPRKTRGRGGGRHNYAGSSGPRRARGERGASGGELRPVGAGSVVLIGPHLRPSVQCQPRPGGPIPHPGAGAPARAQNSNGGANSERKRSRGALRVWQDRVEGLEYALLEFQGISSNGEHFMAEASVEVHALSSAPAVNRDGLARSGGKEAKGGA
ncbi:hypothetical protein C8R47DRAFT_1082145 [Mycena vitilis]|nr:hypothetical protein C8R47DRAFT_1082145 [Mycena vitilis]